MEMAEVRGVGDYGSYVTWNVGRGAPPGNPDASELLRRVTSADESERMPAGGERLSDDDIAMLRQWIQEASCRSDQGVRAQSPVRCATAGVALNLP